MSRWALHCSPCALTPLFVLIFACPAARGGPLYTVTDLGPFDAYGINNAGQVVGNADTSNHQGTYAFRYDSYGPQAGTITPVGGPYSTASAINQSGEVVGSDHWKPVLWTAPGQMVPLTTPPGAWGGANAINGSGQIAGWGWPQVQRPAPPVAMVSTNGQTTQLGSLPVALAGLASGMAYGINDAGQVVGTSYAGRGSDGNPSAHATLWSQGQTTDLGTLGGLASGANAINDQGQVVGSAQLKDGTTHAFLYQNGTMTDLGAPTAGSNSSAEAINNHGQVVGWSRSGGAFLYQNGTMTSLNSFLATGSPWNLVDAKGINDQGQIIAIGHDGDGFNHTILLTPSNLPAPVAPLAYPEVVPEPSTLAIFGLALAALGWARRPRLARPS